MKLLRTMPQNCVELHLKDAMKRDAYWKKEVKETMEEGKMAVRE